MLVNVVWVSVFSDFSIVNQFVEVLFRFTAGSPILQYEFPAFWYAPVAIVGYRRWWVPLVDGIRMMFQSNKNANIADIDSYDTGLGMETGI